MRGSSRCRNHGGASLSGLASPLLRSGRYSKHLPARLAEKYREALTDAALLSLREEVCLLDARLNDVLATVADGENQHLWNDLRRALREHDSASTDEDRAVAVATIGRLIDSGHREFLAWGEIRLMLQERRNLVESERKRLVEMQQMMTSQQANILLGVVAHIIHTHVPDRDARQAISAELNALVTREE